MVSFQRYYIPELYPRPTNSLWFTNLIKLEILHIIYSNQNKLFKFYFVLNIQVVDYITSSKVSVNSIIVCKTVLDTKQVK